MNFQQNQMVLFLKKKSFSRTLNKRDVTLLKVLDTSWYIFSKSLYIINESQQGSRHTHSEFSFFGIWMSIVKIRFAFWFWIFFSLGSYQLFWYEILAFYTVVASAQCIASEVRNAEVFVKTWKSSSKSITEYFSLIEMRMIFPIWSHFKKKDLKLPLLFSTFLVVPAIYTFSCVYNSVVHLKILVSSPLVYFLQTYASGRYY